MQRSERGEFKPFDASDWRVGVAVAKFNADITGQLLDSALERAKDYRLDKMDITEVAGSIELPLALQSLARSGKYRALLAVGCVIQGETPHFDYVCKFVCEGVLRVQLDEHMPIGFGVLTCADLAQAQARAHLGGEHLDAVMQQARAISSRG